jgi:hypothetical protein
MASRGYLAFGFAHPPDDAHLQYHYSIHYHLRPTRKGKKKKKESNRYTVDAISFFFEQLGTFCQTLSCVRHVFPPITSHGVTVATPDHTTTSRVCRMTVCV